MSKYIYLRLLPLTFALCTPVLAADAPKQAAPAAPPAQADDALATALRSYYLLQQENSQLKDSLGKEVDTLRAQLRQAQDQIAALSAENASLKIRLALSGPPPAGHLSVPTRPVQN
jgi:septal ring factor EnvC (AmiA/AmiB activator)